MEFNNALSHIISASIGLNSDIPGNESNFNKAKVHIQRATLDCYKGIIKDFDFLDKMDIPSLQKLKDLRQSEYKAIGQPPLKRKEIIDGYENFVTIYLDIK